MNDESQQVPESERDEVYSVEAPGRRLREAREAKNLTTKEIAQQLKLKQGFIDALESDDYASLPSVLFARGYLKSYARLLGLPADEIVGAFDHQGITEEVSVPHGAILTSKRHRRGERIVLKWGSAAVIVALIGLLVVWFQGESTDELLARLGISKPSNGSTVELSAPLPATVSNSATPTEQPSGTEAQTVNVSGTSNESALETPGDTETTLSTAAVNGAEAGVAADSESEETTPEQTLATTEPVAETAPPSQQLDSTESIADEESVATTVDSSEASTDRVEESAVEVSGVLSSADADSLELTLQADSWTEVTDASGYKLVYRLLRAGDVHRITGRAPFTIFLGNAPAVEVRFNDELVTDIRANRKGVARFTLGSS